MFAGEKSNLLLLVLPRIGSLKEKKNCLLLVLVSLRRTQQFRRNKMAYVEEAPLFSVSLYVANVIFKRF